MHEISQGCKTRCKNYWRWQVSNDQQRRLISTNFPFFVIANNICTRACQKDNNCLSDGHFESPRRCIKRISTVRPSTKQIPRRCAVRIKASFSSCLSFRKKSSPICWLTGRSRKYEWKIRSYPGEFDTVRAAYCCYTGLNFRL